MPTDPELEEISRRIEQLTRTKGDEAEAGEEEPEEAVHPPEPVRYRNILVGYDGSQGAQDALAWAEAIADKHDATITLALVLPPTPQTRGGGLIAVSQEAEGTINAILEDDVAHGSQMLQDTRDRLQARGFSCKSLLAQGRPANEFLRLPELEEADLVILGAHEKSGTERLLLGSVSNAVAGKASSSVLIARGPPPVKRALLAVDRAPLSKQAAAGILALPRPTQELRVVHVLPLPFAGFSERAQELIQEQTPRIQREVETTSRVEHERVRFDVLFGKPAERILETARQNDVGLIACGAHRLGRVQEWLLGSVSNQIVHRAECSVLLFRQ